MAKITELIKVEFLLAVEGLKRTDTWMYFVTVVVLISAFYQSWVVLVASFIILFLLSVKRHNDAGTITNYLREKDKFRASKEYATIKDLVSD